MAIDFLAMLNEQKKVQQEAEKASQKPKQSKGTIEPKKAEKPKKQKESPKKEVKKKTFDEQYKDINNTYIKMVVDHLLSLDGMKEKMEDERVSIENMWQYIRKKARKEAVNGCAMISDDVVYGWGRHYYDEYGNVA